MDAFAGFQTIASGASPEFGGGAGRHGQSTLLALAATDSMAPHMDLFSNSSLAATGR
jgi:hypothetical protein